MLIHRKNSFAPRNRRYTGRHEAQSREIRQQTKNLPCTNDILNLTQDRGIMYADDTSVLNISRNINKVKNKPQVIQD
jgi:hypothetical protein